MWNAIYVSTLSRSYMKRRKESWWNTVKKVMCLNLKISGVFLVHRVIQKGDSAYASFNIIEKLPCSYFDTQRNFVRFDIAEFKIWTGFSLTLALLHQTPIRKPYFYCKDHLPKQFLQLVGKCTTPRDWRFLDFIALVSWKWPYVVNLSTFNTFWGKGNEQMPQNFNFYCKFMPFMKQDTN